MTKNITIKILASILLITGLSSATFLENPHPGLPVTGNSQVQQTVLFPQITKAQNASAGVVSQVSVANKFTYQVVQSGNNAPAGNVVGQYAYAANRGSIGLLAHNYAAGASFYTLNNGDEVLITYNNGTTKRFIVSNVLRFQASDPNDFSQPFFSSNGKELTAKQVFSQAYKTNWVTFQTCIQNGGSPTWGLLFVQATPKN